MSNTDSTKKKQGWIYVLSMAQKFLPLIRHLPCCSNSRVVCDNSVCNYEAKAAFTSYILYQIVQGESELKVGINMTVRIMIKEQISHLTFLFKFIFYLWVIYYECARNYGGIYIFCLTKQNKLFYKWIGGWIIFSHYS